MNWLFGGELSRNPAITARWNFIDPPPASDTIRGDLVFPQATMFHRQSGTRISVRVPAKLNLFLEVLGKRPDGFHELETLMTTVGVEDALSLNMREDGQVTLDCDWADGWRLGESWSGQRPQRIPQDRFELLRADGGSAAARPHAQAAQAVFAPLPGGDENLVVRALKTLQQLAVAENPDSLARGGVAASLVKSIPAAAGLGGAS
ncbi:MAG: hypothetical protein ACKO38_16710, partial [Planctomycetota bacterium]